jgi:hypothetical protein
MRASDPDSKFHHPLMANARQNVAARSRYVNCSEPFASPDGPVAVAYVTHHLYRDGPASIGFVCAACQGEDDERLSAAAVESVLRAFGRGNADACPCASCASEIGR